MAGAVLLALVDYSEGWTRVSAVPAVFVIFALGALLGELFPIKMPGKEDEITTSTCFMYALLIVFGLAPAVVVQVLISVVADLLQRKSPLSIAFNAGQLTITLAVTALVLSGLGDLPHPSLDTALTPSDIPAIAAAAATFFAVNNLLAGIAWALASRTRIVALLRDDLGFQAWTTFLLLGFAPIVIAVSSYGLFLVPVLLLPVLAIHRSSREARLSEYRSLHDRLTDLPNRVLFHDRAQSSITAARRSGESVSVLIMDLNRFKEVNDTLGHHHGDLLLQAVGPRLDAVLRESDTIARMGGDEFAVLLPEVGAEDAAMVAHKLLTALSEPFDAGGVTLDVDASIGIACYPRHGEDVDTLIQRGDVAMYMAKSSHTKVELYSSEQDPYSKDRLALVAQLRVALDERQFIMHFQPQVDLGTGRLTGVEALVRWQHPTRGILYPDTFIPLAELTGLIPRITVEALRLSIAQGSEWRRRGLDMVVAVNVSSRDLHDRELPARVAGLLREYDLPADRLALEITESMLMVDPERAREILAELSATGVGIAVDDFGTGYSSLAYLKRLPIDKIKIDRSFVMGMTQDESDRHIVASTVDLGHNLGLHTVAEGVEDRASYEELARMGCQQAQGYHLSRPLPAEGLEKWAASLAHGDIDLGRHAGSGSAGDPGSHFAPSTPRITTRQ
ncbi:MAG: bifunctional diguanylate cyclase/phosphodiesterase [Solirubrobacterales bacterium]|nr:bifunctional diguanylate cyclase/phosphodiesterase [Solirubrobacterales bacterium]